MEQTSSEYKEMQKQQLFRKLSKEEKKAYLSSLKGASLASDGFFPFRDNIDRAAKSAVCYVAEPGGSTRDDDIISAADEHGMVLVFTNFRLFHH